MSFWDYLWIFGAFAIAAFFGVVSARHFGEKGYLFNNAYIWASKDEREKMDKKPYYRQSAVIFAILCAAFACMGLYMIFRDAWCLACELVCLVAAGVYAVASEISINKKKKQ